MFLLYGSRFVWLLKLNTCNVKVCIYAFYFGILLSLGHGTSDLWKIGAEGMIGLFIIHGK
jgi:hypothetical protein